MVVPSNFKIDESLFKFKRIIAFSVLLLVFMLLLSLNVFSSEINVIANNLEYSGKQGDGFLARGNVVIEWEGKKVYADYIEFFLEEKIVNACGNVKVEESKSVIYADSVTYNYDKESGNMKEIFGYSSSNNSDNNKFVRAGYIERDVNEANMYNMNNIRLSNCDLDSPHVYLKAKRGKIILNKRVTIYNAILYINKIPVLYIPIFTKSLSDEKDFFSKLKINPIPCYDEKEFFLRTMFSYPLAKFLTGSITFCCPFNFKGRTNRWNASLDYKTESAKGTVNTYHDPDNSKSRVELDYFQMISNIWSIRSKATAYLNSSKISNYENYKHSYAILTRQKKDSNLSIGLSVLQHNKDKVFYKGNEDPVSNYKKTFLMHPEINFTYYPRNIFLGIMHKFSLVYDNTLHDNYYLDGYKCGISSTVCLNYTLTRSFNFWERFTLNPTLEMFTSLSFEDKFRRNFHNAFIIKCGGCLNLRYRVTDCVDLNLNYCPRKIENKKDIFNTISKSGSDYGCNVLSLADYIYIGNAAIVINSFSFSEKKLPFVTEIMWNPKSFVSVYVKQSQLLRTFKTDYLKFSFKIGDLSKSYLNFDVFYKSNDNSNINSILGFGLWVSPKWRLDYNMIISNRNRPSIFGVKGFEFKIHRNLHCYNLGVLFRITKNSSGSLVPCVFLQFNEKIDTLFNKEKQKVGYFKDFKGMPESWFYS